MSTCAVSIHSSSSSTAIVSTASSVKSFQATTTTRSDHIDPKLDEIKDETQQQQVQQEQEQQQPQHHHHQQAQQYHYQQVQQAQQYHYQQVQQQHQFYPQHEHQPQQQQQQQQQHKPEPLKQRKFSFSKKPILNKPTPTSSRISTIIQNNPPQPQEEIPYDIDLRKLSHAYRGIIKDLPRFATKDEYEFEFENRIRAPRMGRSLSCLFGSRDKDGSESPQQG
ncbi:unnamed protein product [Ambrosiozyma monospora]|uniref:Unnamed protein product n=1 Tax=Ambrosiozyma monospora TaxID=43982 RepID=A0A9W6YZS2_AMBMO|nr:unnamed protein product [Ambrosiozyma monospora]